MMAGPAVACHLQIIEIPGNGFQVTCRRPRRLMGEENKTWWQAPNLPPV